MGASSLCGPTYTGSCNTAHCTHTHTQQRLNTPPPHLHHRAHHTLPPPYTPYCHLPPPYTPYHHLTPPYRHPYHPTTTTLHPLPPPIPPYISHHHHHHLTPPPTPSPLPNEPFGRLKIEIVKFSLRGEKKSTLRQIFSYVCSVAGLYVWQLTSFGRGEEREGVLHIHRGG